MHHSKMASTALVLLLASTTPIFASPLSRRSEHSVDNTKPGEYDIDGVPFVEEFFAEEPGRRRSPNSDSSICNEQCGHGDLAPYDKCRVKFGWWLSCGPDHNGVCPAGTVYCAAPPPTSTQQSTTEQPESTTEQPEIGDDNVEGDDNGGNIEEPDRRRSLDSEICNEQCGHGNLAPYDKCRVKFGTWLSCGPDHNGVCPAGTTYCAAPPPTSTQQSTTEQPDIGDDEAEGDDNGGNIGSVGGDDRPKTPSPSTPNPTPSPTPSPSTSSPCKPWCATNSRPWSKKCNWKKCAGCNQCN